ncbi:MAG: hypothetical protein ABR507_00840 [Actinomycetota bacterium]|nr:hypothetical protein [Actinomycetota bacterium]
MQIQDGAGRPLDEVTLKLDQEEVTQLLVGASQIDDGSSDHALIRDHAGTVLAVYIEDSEPGPLKKGTDWWLGPIILVGVIVLVVGLYTIARGLVGLLF